MNRNLYLAMMYLTVIVLLILFSCTVSFAKIAPEEIQRAVYIVNNKNIENGAELERIYNIPHRDGKFNCVDRAFLGQRLARHNGYKSIISIIDNGKLTGHASLFIFDDDKAQEILK